MSRRNKLIKGKVIKLRKLKRNRKWRNLKRLGTLMTRKKSLKFKINLKLKMNLNQ